MATSVSLFLFFPINVVFLLLTKIAIRRVFVIDINRQSLVALNDDGFICAEIDIGAKFGITWPHQVVYVSRKGIEAGDVFKLYISEYLG